MTKIKDVTALANRTKIINNTADFFTDSFLTAKHHHGIHIALQRDTVTNALTCLAKVNSPINTQCISTAFFDILEPLSPPLGKDDHRDTHTIALTLQTCDNLFGVLQRELLE